MAIDLIKLADDPSNNLVLKTARTERINTGNGPSDMPVYRVALELLTYNVRNDRVASWVSAYRADHKDAPLEQLESEEINRIIEGFIVESNPPAIKQTQNNIKMRMQERPGVVLPDGIVIDGNRRFTCLRRLHRELPERESDFGYFDTVILPQSYASDPATIKKLELSIQHATEEKVGYDPVNRLVGIYNDIINSETRLLSEAEYARFANIEPKELTKLKEQAIYLVEFLDYIGQPKQFHIARDLKVAGPFGEMPAILKKCDNDSMREELKPIIFANLVAEPQSDPTRFIRKMKKIMASDGARDFIESESDLAAEICERMAACSDNPREGIKDIRGDEALSEELVSKLERAEENASRQKALSSPADCIKKATRALNQVEESLFCEYRDIDKDKLRDVERALDELGRRMNEIRTELDNCL